MSYNRRKVMAALGRRGARVVREGGRHTLVESADKTRRAAVPRHNQLARGTTRVIVEQLGMDWDSVKKELT
jgi:predicted RNA binding protein YcfA (HicA-like mRNA interferase family)